MPVGDYSELDEFRGTIEQPNGEPVIPRFVQYESGTNVLTRPTAQQLVDANPELGGGAGVTQIYKMSVAGVVTSYADPTAAKAGAVSGETVFVGPGAYTITASLAKAGVNWHFLGVGSVTMTVNSTEGIWDDGNTAMTFTVIAPGFDFIRTSNGATDTHGIRLRHASSNFFIHCRDFTATSSAGSNETAALKQEAGRIVLIGRVLHASTATLTAYTLWWTNGSGVVRATRIFGDYTTVWSQCDAAPTGDFHVYAEEIEGSLFASGLNASAACWIQANTVRGNYVGNGSVNIEKANKFYLRAQKLFGVVLAQDYNGLAYIETQKHEALENGDDVEGEASFIAHKAGLGTGTGTIFYKADHWDQAARTGRIVKLGELGTVFTGTLELSVRKFIGTANSKGIDVDGGTLRITADTYINTAANSSANPITITAGTIKVEGRLISNGSIPTGRKCIKNGDAGTYTVDCWGARANNAPDTGITANGLVVDSTVT